MRKVYLVLALLVLTSVLLVPSVSAIRFSGSGYVPHIFYGDWGNQFYSNYWNIYDHSSLDNYWTKPYLSGWPRRW